MFTIIYIMSCTLFLSSHVISVAMLPVIGSWLTQTGCSLLDTDRWYRLQA